MAAGVKLRANDPLAPSKSQWPNGRARGRYAPAVGDVSLSSTQHRLTVTVRGKIDQQLGAELRTVLGEWLVRSHETSEVMLDLREVHDYDILGRVEMIAAHGVLAGAGRRCAYVTAHPRIRGLALLTIGEVGDRGSRAVTTIEQGEAWLRGREAVTEASIEQGQGAPRRRG